MLTAGTRMGSFERGVDKRADIWAFGCVLFELLTARRPSDGESLSDVIAGVLEREPPWSALRPDTPAQLRRLLRRCVEKDPKARLRDIADARANLEADPGRTGGSAVPASRRPAITYGRPRGGGDARGRRSLVALDAAARTVASARDAHRRHRGP